MDASLNSSDVSDSAEPLSGLISTSLYMQLMNVVIGVDFVVSVIATAANIATITVYRRLGFQDSTNISLTALAVSDLGVALTTTFSVLATLLPTIPSAPFTYEVFMAFAFTPHLWLTRTSALITTYLSVERYLCVLIPLKIKSVITPKRTFIAMLTIFIIVLGPWPYVFFRYPIGWKVYMGRNKTLLGVLPVEDPTVTAVGYALQIYMSLFLPMLTFTTVLCTTILLSISLQTSKAWRDANKSVGKTVNDSSESKEKRAIKMVMAIATVLIVSTIPSTIHMVFTLAVPEFILGGRYSNLYSLAGMIFHSVDCINCSCNVVIYYNMSSKFRSAMLGILSPRKRISGKKHTKHIKGDLVDVCSRQTPSDFL